MFSVLAFAAQASAHAFLKTAAPAVGSVVHESPAQVDIEFTESVEPGFSTIRVTDGSGARVDSGAVHLDGGDNRLATSLKPLAPGRYSVVWHAVSTDTHKTDGKFSFTLKP